jgi:RNA polymerase sigma-70 factor (ECF subfamily)
MSTLTMPTILTPALFPWKCGKMMGIFRSHLRVESAGAYGMVQNKPKEEIPPLNGLDVLIRRCQDGDSAAMQSLYERYKRQIFNLAYRYTYNRASAEDLLHDIFIKVFDQLHKLDTTQAFQGWLYRVAVNTCLSYLRSRRSPVKNTVSFTDAAFLEPSQYDNKSLVKSALDAAINELPMKLKSVVLLHDVQGHKHQEIAEIMGWSVGTSKSQLFKARMKIRKILESRSQV